LWGFKDSRFKDSKIEVEVEAEVDLLIRLFVYLLRGFVEGI